MKNYSFGEIFILLWNIKRLSTLVYSYIATHMRHKYVDKIDGSVREG